MFQQGDKDTKLYKTLGVDTTASASEIKKVYRKLAMKYHPDKQISKTEEEQKKAEERFKEISQAYDILGDENKKQSYDQFGMSGVGPGGNTGPQFNTGGMPNIFNNIFGGGMRQQQTRLRVGKSRNMNIFVTLSEIYREIGKLIEITRYAKCGECNGVGGKTKHNCETCDGKGSILKIQQIAPGFVQQSQQNCHKCSGSGSIIRREDICSYCSGKARVSVVKKLKINLTKKTRDKEQIKLENYSDYEPNVDKQGDFIFTLRMKEDPFYKVNENNIYCHISIKLEEALCGLEQEITLPCGTKKRLNITEVIHPNEIYSIVGEGLKDNHNRIGDIEIEFKVLFPSKIDKERKIYLQKLLKRYNPTHSIVDSSLSIVTPIKMNYDRNMSHEQLHEEPIYNDPLFEEMEGAPQCVQQ
jgi:DnaJ-class molecular chaperone